MFSHPLFRRFKNELSVAEQVFEWEKWQSNFVWRPRNADDTVIWFLLSRADLGSLLLSENNASNFPDSRTKIEQLFRGRKFWRWWQLESGEECFLRSRYGIFCAHNGEFVRFDYPFRFSDVAYAKPDDIETFLKSDELKPELETAQRWSQTPIAQRVRQLLVLRGGSFDEFDALIQGALVLGGGQEARFDMRDVMVMPGRVLLYYQSSWQQEHPVNEFFYLLNAHFRLERTMEEWREHDEFGDPAEVPYPIYISSQPNHHELLEAQLSWREFLRGKLPEEEIARLLHI